MVVLDLCEYIYHWAQHNVRWMWALHSLHHSQQNMNLWSDDRNHMLDNLVHDIIFGLIAVLIGWNRNTSCWCRLAHAAACSMPTCASTSAAWANTCWCRRVSTGPITPSAWAMKAGAAIPWADTISRCCSPSGMFSSAPPTSARLRHDRRARSMPPPAGKGRDYGRGFWAQQWLGLKRLVEFTRRKPR
jgi:hypothetical protein